MICPRRQVVERIVSSGCGIQLPPAGRVELTDEGQCSSSRNARNQTILPLLPLRS
jgi:hypothetical protein